MNCFFKYLLYALPGLCATACNAFEEHPYAPSLDGPRDIHLRTIREIEATDCSDGFTFAFLSDTQGSYDETREALEIIAARGDVDFIVHGGDQTDFGLPKEYMWCRDMFERTGIPYVMIIGNHDCVGNGDDTFRYLYGTPNYSFDVGDTHFLCLNTVALEYDYSCPVPDLDFMEKDCTEVRRRNEECPGTTVRTIVAMHSHPYDEQFNNNVAKPFNEYLRHYPGMGGDGGAVTSFCINGHNHSLDIKDIFDNGILYYQAPNIAKRSFFVFTVKNNDYSYEIVDF